MRERESRVAETEALKGAPQEALGAGVEAQPERGVTVRALAWGLCVAVGVNLLATTVRFVQKGSYMIACQMPMGNLILCLLSILASAALARWFGRRFVFSQGEWLTVFCMGLISAVGPNYGISGYLVGLMASPYYFATSENRWAEYLHPHLPGWLIPTNETGAMTWFYEGLPQGASIPWEVWAAPLMWWFAFLLVLGFACICASVIFHRQWADHERLVYPALTPILEMTSRAGSGRRALPEFMRGKAFWAGFALTSFVFWWNMVSWFYPLFPTFPTAEGTFIWGLLPKHYPPFFVFLSTPVICFSYFASLDVLFSVWFFDLLFIVEGGALNRLGVVATSPHYGAGPYTSTSYKWQSAGAFISLVLWWFWVARKHLREVLRKALRPDRSRADDSRELLSCRTAVVGLIASCLYIAIWLGQVGIEARMVILLVPATLIVHLGMAKILAESGLIYMHPPASAWETSLIPLRGADVLQTSTRGCLGLLSFNLDHNRSFIMPYMVYVNRLGDFVQKDRHRLFWGILGAFVFGVATSLIYTIWLGYTMGAYNFQPNFLIVREGAVRHEMTVENILNPKSLAQVDYWLFLGGVGTMALILLMRYRFIWWPLHPVGFAVSGVPATRLMGSTVLVAWLVKLLMLRIGGVSFYRRTGPFFIGMLIGYILAVIAGMVIDAIWFPEQGHVVHKWY